MSNRSNQEARSVSMVDVQVEDTVDISRDSDWNNDRSTSKVGVDDNNENKEDGDEGLKRITELSMDDIFGLEFGSEVEACNFYFSYAKSRGFVARKDEIRRDAMGEIKMHRLVCNREGKRSKRHFGRLDRSREHRSITRTMCPARFRVHIYGKHNKWIVAAFKDTHNHKLTPPKQVHLIPSYRSMTNVDKAQVDSLHLYGVRTCHIMGLMLGQKGGHGDLGFCKKDLYNHIDR